MTAGEERTASWLELFFDLVLVAAVAALAAELHADRDVTGLLVFAGLFVPVWWAWWGYTWFSSAYDDGTTATRVAYLAAMAGVAVLATGVHGAAHGRSDTFAAACAGLFGLLALLHARVGRRLPGTRGHTVPNVVGNAVGAALWLVTIGLDEGARPVVWGVAMLVLMGAPVLGARRSATLTYDARHIAERYGLFTLIVLGESVARVVGGLGAASGRQAALTAVLGFAIAAAIWWLYFDRWRPMPSGGLRSGWTWAQGHGLLFAGIAAGAVGVELAIEAAGAGETLPFADRLPLGAGLAAFLLAMAAIRAATRGADRVVALRCLAAATVLGVAAVPGLAPALTVGLVAAGLGAAVALDLRWAPAEVAGPRPALPYQRRTPRL